MSKQNVDKDKRHIRYKQNEKQNSKQNEKQNTNIEKEKTRQTREERREDKTQNQTKQQNQQKINEIMIAEEPQNRAATICSEIQLDQPLYH